MPVLFDLGLPPLALEGGGWVDPHVVRGFHFGPRADLLQLRRAAEVLPPALLEAPAAVVRRAGAVRIGSAQLDPSVPTVVVVHALTGDARVGGPQGFWSPLCGPGKALDPDVLRILCFNLLGSCYGTSGPLDPTFPGGPDGAAALTTWDQAFSILAALDALGIEKVALVTGGSLGAMVSLCLAALAPQRVERLAPIAGSAASSAWVVGLNHVGRQAIRLDPGFPGDVSRGLEVARQLAMLSYRAEAGLEERQRRPSVWNPLVPYPIETYLEHQGRKLSARFHGASYLALTGAMDHHDLGRAPGSRTATDFGLPRIRASTLSVSIDTDQLFFPARMRDLAARLRAHVHVEEAQVESPHGHDAFLIEWRQMEAILKRALSLPGATP